MTEFWFQVGDGEKQGINHLNVQIHNIDYIIEKYTYKTSDIYKNIFWLRKIRKEIVIRKLLAYNYIK